MSTAKEIKWLLSTGILFAILFFSGYLYLTIYFIDLAVPISDLSIAEVALMGFIPSMLSILTALITFLFFILISAIIFRIFKTKVKAKIKERFKKNYFNFLIIGICLLPFTIYFWASFNNTRGYPYNYIPISKRTSRPIVSVSYKSSLVSNYAPLVVTNQIDKGTSTKSNSQEEVKNYDAVFFKDIFILYFESKDSYFFKARKDLFYTRTSITFTESGNTTIIPVGFYNDINSGFIVIPKSNILALIYLENDLEKDFDFKK
ncbi:MAG: hypothetical protein HYT15_04805 [Candidatus Magasanikbacteria bacterium]|nr:hypothetical protein [Candidatus Magasanikbacteria bacterium]